MANKNQDEEKRVKIIFDQNASTAATDVNKLKASLDKVEVSAKDADKSFKNIDKTFEQVYGDLQPLTTRLGEAEDRLYELSLAGQTTTEEFRLLLQTVANYRRVQIQTDQTVDAAATTIGQKLGGAAQIAAVGVQGVTAGMALFGDQSEDTEKALLKVQSAMAFADAISSVSDLGGQFRVLKALVVESTLVNKANAAATALATISQRLFGVAVNTTSTGFKVLKGAIAATGIGLLVVGVVALIQNFDKVKEVALNFIPALASVGKTISNIVNSVTDFIGLTSQTDRLLAKSKQKAEENIAQNERYLERNASTLSESRKKEIELNNEHFSRIAEGRFSEAESLLIYNEAQRKEVREKNKILNDLEKAAQEKRNATAKALREKAAAARATAIEKEKEEALAGFRRAEDQFDQGLKVQKEALKSTANALLSDNELKVQTENEAFAKKLEILKVFNQSTEAVEIEHKRVLAQLNNEFFAGEADKAKKTGESKILIATQVAEAENTIQQKQFEVAEKGISLIKSLFGRNKVIQKASLIAESAIGIAKMIISTKAANAAAVLKYALLPGGTILAAKESVLNNVSTGIGIAANVAATAKGLQALGGGGAPSAPSLNTSGGGGGVQAATAPSVSFNNTAENQIGQSLGKAQANQPAQRVFVLESDIKDATNNVKALVIKNSF
jgi:flagellar biosynthesis protein FliQ